MLIDKLNEFFVNEYYSYMLTNCYGNIFVIYKNKNNQNNQNIEALSSKRIKVVTVKPQEGMKKPLSRINDDPEHYRTMFSGPAVYSEDLKHINSQDSKAVDWKMNGVVPKPGNPLANYQPSAVAIANAERVTKRNAKEAFDEVFALKKSIRKLEGFFKI